MMHASLRLEEVEKRDDWYRLRKDVAKDMVARMNGKAQAKVKAQAKPKGAPAVIV